MHDCTEPTWIHILQMIVWYTARGSEGGGEGDQGRDGGDGWHMRRTEGCAIVAGNEQHAFPLVW